MTDFLKHGMVEESEDGHEEEGYEEDYADYGVGFVELGVLD